MNTINEKQLDEKNRKLWLRALGALQTGNLDYGIELMHPVIKDNPGFLDGRKALRQAQVARKKKQKKKLFSLGGDKLGIMKLKSQIKGDPEAALSLIEKALDEDPYSVDANELLHQVAVRLEFPELAIFALETIREGHPDNTKKMHDLAQYYLTLDDPEKAAEVYQIIATKDPSDMIAVKGGKDATAKASMRKGRWEEGFKASMKSEEESLELEAQSRTGMTREQVEGLLGKALEEYAADQENLAVSKKVASLYERLEDWANAAQFYQWAYHLSKGDTALERKAAQMDENRIEAEVEAKEKEVEAMGDTPEAEAARKELADLKRERSLRMVDEARKRVEGNPTDPQLRFEYGQHLFNSEQYSEAIPQLQRARNNPHLRTRTLLLLGRCYEAKKMYDLAEGQLEEALSELSVMDNTKKDVLYMLALVCESMDKKDKYLDYLKRIYESDYGYRDVAQRVESSYGS